MSARYGDNRSGGGGFFMGIVTGSLLGAALAVLFAPKPGADMRRDLAEGAEGLGQAAKERWEDLATAASSAVDKGRDAYAQARGTASDMAETVGESVDRVTQTAKHAANAVVDAGASSAPAATAAAGSWRS